jgi:hypothetical protein
MGGSAEEALDIDRSCCERQKKTRCQSEPRLYQSQEKEKERRTWSTENIEGEVRQSIAVDAGDLLFPPPFQPINGAFARQYNVP